MQPTPRFIQGVFSFEGRGLDAPSPLGAAAQYTVASDKRAQLVYLRGGNSSGELIYVVLTRNGKPMRYFPLGARDGQHVPLAVVEDIYPESRLEVLVAAPPGTRGSLVLDIGILEVD